MAAEPGSEHAEGDMSKDNVKRDKKKKKKEEEEQAGTKGQEHPSDTTTVENLATERDEAEGKQSAKSKKSKRKRGDAGEASGNDQAVTGEGKKRKKEHPVALEESGQKQQSLDTAVQNLATRFDEAEGEQSGKSNKSKIKRNDAGETQQKTLDATVENSVAKSNEAEGKQSSKSKKTKSKPDDAGDGQQKTLDGNVENSVAKSDEVEGKESSKSKKTKSKRGEASAGDQDLTRKDKKRKKEHPDVLEKSSEPKNTSEGENGEIKERGKEGNTSSLESSENVSAGGEEADVDGKNDKKKQEIKEGTAREGIKEKEKAARPMNKGKRVSFADSTEVFEPEGGDGEGTGGGKKKKTAQSKNKGKRVSFADSTEVFETEGGGGEGTEGGKKKGKKAAQSMNKGKRVSFADSAEVFETEGGDDEEGGTSDEPKFVHGVRFTQEEDDTLMEAIKDFIEMKQLGEKGLEMFRTPRKHKELLHCWDVIGKSLPHRPHNAIYKRARILLNRSEVRGWTGKEKEYIRSFVKKNGTDWKKLADELCKCNIHVKDTWRRIKSDKLKKGYWTQDEHQKLFDLVNLDLRMKAHQIKNPDNRKLRDNISWEAISDKLSTRNHKNCCLKWYDTLASPLVRKGVWADLDDYLLVEALQKDDAICIEDVDWDSLLDHRSGQVCRQRWNQMVRGLGGHREKPFIEQVDVLSQRYCSEMIEYRKGSEETPAGDANGDKKKKKSKESEEPGVANAEVEKEKKKKKKKSEESEEPGAANAKVEKEKKKSTESKEPGAANAEVEKDKKKSTESEEPGAANAEVEKETKKKKKKSKETKQLGAANAEVEKQKKKKSKESEEPGAANVEVERKKKKKSKESEEPGAANAEVERKKKTDTQDDEVVAMEAKSRKKDKKKKIKQADQ